MTGNFKKSFLILCAVDLGIRYLMNLIEDEGTTVILLWSGPISTIFFTVLALEGLLWFFDASEKDRPDPQVAPSVSNLRFLVQSFLADTGWAERLAAGSRRALILLSCLSLLVAIWASQAVSPLAIVLERVLYIHILNLLSVSLCCVVFLRLVGRLRSASGWGAVALFGLTCLLVPAWNQGRLEDLFFHITHAPESLLSWAYAACWSVFGANRIPDREAS